MPPISIIKLAELCRARNLEWPESAEAKKLKDLLGLLKESAVRGKNIKSRHSKSMATLLARASFGDW